MDRIKTRQEKFKKGKEKILSMTQESGDGQNLIPPEEEEDDDGMTRGLSAIGWYRLEVPENIGIRIRIVTFCNF